MREFICIACGTKGIDNSAGQKKKYCSIECANKARYHKKAAIEMDCKFNRGVGCLVQDCEKCGWNPEVAKIRLEKIKKELQEDGK